MSTGDEQPATRLLTSRRPETSTGGRFWSRRRIVIGVVGVLVVCVVITVVVSSSGSKTSPHTNAPVSPAPGPPPLQGDTRAGAQAAAANDVVALGGIAMFNPASRNRAIDEVADPAVAASLRTQFTQAYTASYTAFGLDKTGHPPAGQTLVARAVPIGTHVLTFNSNAATVQVWSAGLIGLAGSQSTHPVTEAWTTTSVRLRWDGHRWRWLSGTQSDGPTPVPGLQAPSSADAIAAAAKTFGALTYG